MAPLGNLGSGAACGWRSGLDGGTLTGRTTLAGNMMLEHVETRLLTKFGEVGRSGRFDVLA